MELLWSPVSSGPTALGLWSIYHHVGDAQLCRCSCSQLHLGPGLQLRQPGEEVPDMTSPDFPEYGSRRCPGEYRWVLGGWLNPARIFYRRCWHPKSSQILSVFKDELINSGNQLQQFPGNPCIFIAFFTWKTTRCRKGRIAEYIREMDDLVENFGPGWGFGGVEQAMCFLSVFLFWWGPTYTFGFWGNSRFLDVLLGSVI